MKKSKIQALTASSASAAANAIEAALKDSARPTKKQALRVLASRKLCSETSDKSLKTFLNHVISLEVPLPPTFSNLMGIESKAATPAPAASSPEPTVGKEKKKMDVAIALKGASIIHVKGLKAKVSYPDGSVISVGGIDASALRSSLTSLEFNVSE